MRIRYREAYVLLALGALAGVLLTPMIDAAQQGAANPVESQMSPVFTPAHRSLADAFRDFFGMHPTPVQPIAYTHKVHLANGMDCTNCHTNVENGPVAGIPSIKLCMMCHQAVATDKPEIKKMAALYARGEDVQWQRVYDYSPASHLKFNHAPHLRAKMECITCHGDMRQRTVALRTVNMNMGFCINCHKLKKVSVECITCHY